MKILLTYWKLNFLSLIEYKVNFLVEIVSMLINNFIFVSVWYLFFLRFWTIWWMDFWHFALLSCIMVLIFAIIHMFFVWYIQMWTMIEQWKLDSHLLLPKNILLRLLTSRMYGSAFWDLVYAFLLLIFVPNVTFVLVLKIILVAIFWAATYLWFLLIFISLSFFVWSSRNMVNWAREAILWPGHYPPWIFEWTILKYILMTIIPVFYVVFLPYELVFNFTFKWFLSLLAWSSFFLFLWVYIFYKWLNRYESWNMLNTNV